MEAIVYKSTGSWYRVRKSDGILADARVRGRLKTQEITSTNPVAVGDIVTITEDPGGDTMITDILERKNYVIRQSPQNKNLQHIIAANLDQSILMGSLKNPRTSTGFVDRFLVVCEAYHIPAIIVFNKSDLNGEKEKKQFAKIKEMYEMIGYPVMLTSVKTGDGLQRFKDILKDKQTLISGHSGVGKSSLINLYILGGDIKTQDVSGWSGKGVHTTTFAEMYDLPFGGRIIDTPGVREFGLIEIEPVELSHYFVEMRPLISKCRFNNCLHAEEPDCAIKDAVTEGIISAERYFSYLNILDSIGS